MAMCDEREEKLPQWARQLIAGLRRDADPNSDELVRMRRNIDRLERLTHELTDRLDRVHEFLRFASRGGSADAAEYVSRVIDLYPIDPE